MKKILIIVFLIISTTCLFAKARHKANTDYISTFKSYFSSHQQMTFNNKIYFKTPVIDDMNANLVLVKNHKSIYDNSYSVYSNSIVYSSTDSISFNKLTSQEILAIAPQINQLIYMLKCLGTPHYELFLRNDPITSFLIINENEKRINKSYESLQEALKALHTQWQARIIYLKLNPIIKKNNHLEFSISILSHEKKTDKKDFAEMKMHFNLDNQIDLAMITIFKDIKE